MMYGQKIGRQKYGQSADTQQFQGKMYL